MNWGKLVYLLFIILIGYLPYKSILRFRKDGLSSLSTRNIVLLSVWFLALSVLLLVQTPNLYIETNTISIISIVATVFFWFGAPQILPRIGKYPDKVLKDNFKGYLTHGEFKFFLSSARCFFNRRSLPIFYLLCLAD